MSIVGCGISFVALDLDGTTLNAESKLSERTQQTLKKLSEEGVTIAILTGRSMPAVYPHVSTLALSRSVPVVSYNGCCGYSLKLSPEGLAVKDQTHFESGLEKKHALEVIQFAVMHNYVVQYYCRQTGTIYAINHCHDDHDSLLAQYSGLTHQIQARKEFRTGDVFDEQQLDLFLDEVPCAKILILDNDIDVVLERAGSTLEQNKYSIIRGSPHSFFAEFLPAGVTKGDGMTQLCLSLGVPLSSVVAFGDGENDVEFLRHAGVGVAVKNARPVTKEAADIVLEWTNDEDGVARHLEQMHVEGKFRPAVVQ